jgi:hypothetical protein
MGCGRTSWDEASLIYDLQTGVIRPQIARLAQ